jgi:D-alanyl-D-alanine carboxypeptidase
MARPVAGSRVVHTMSGRCRVLFAASLLLAAALQPFPTSAAAAEWSPPGVCSPSAASLRAEPQGPSLPTAIPATQLQAVLDRVQSSYPVPGLQAAVIMPDGFTWTGASGRSEIGATARAATPETSFVVGSITKTFVATLVVQLASEGRLSLDDPLSRWLPRYPNAAAITIRELLNHTSGIYNYFEHPKYEALVFKRPNHRWTTTEILSLTGKPYFAPGKGYHYSNTNYVLLGLIAERITGRSLAVEIRRRFLTPLGMGHTHFQDEEPVPVRGAMGYLYNGNRSFKGLWDGSSERPNTSAATVAWAAGAMVSTAGDLATWTRALYGGKVLQPQWLTQMLSFGTYGYGLGVRSVTIAGQPAWGHAGSLRGFTAATWYLPLQQVTVSVTTNRGRIDPNGIAARLAQAVWQEIDEVQPVAEVPVAASVRGSAPTAPALRAVLTWGGRDDLSGIAGYELQRSVGVGDWADVPLKAGARSATVSLRDGESYGFRVRAHDRAGNVGPWAETSGLRLTTHDDTSALVDYSGLWTRTPLPGAFGGGVTSAGSSGRSVARITFIGMAAAFAAAVGRDGGRISVSVDGGRATAVSLASASSSPSRVVFTRSWPTPSLHTVEITVQPEAGARVQLDAFLIAQRLATAPNPFVKRV